MEIKRLYDAGTITREEYDTMVEADRRAACQEADERIDNAQLRRRRQQRRHHGEDGTVANQAPPPTSPTLQISKRLQSLTSQLQKINLPRLIDQLEHDQEIADHLDFINRETAEEVEHKRMVREAEQMSLEIMREHLEEFVSANPMATYESWIGALHPDNVLEDRTPPQAEDAAGTAGRAGDAGGMNIDHRFYVEYSDHRRIWNESLNDDDGREFVPPRTAQGGSAAKDTTCNVKPDPGAGRIATR